jgi:hypothetical protein
MSHTNQQERQTAGGFELLVLLGLMPLNAIFMGWALKTVWNWFVPDVSGWTRIGIAQAVGLAAIVSILRTSHLDNSKSTAERWTGIFATWLGVLMAVGIAWVAHQVVTP